MENTDSDKKPQNLDIIDNPASKLWRLVFFKENEETTHFCIKILHDVLRKGNENILEMIEEMNNNGQVTVGYYVPEIANTLKRNIDCLAEKNEINLRVQIELNE